MRMFINGGIPLLMNLSSELLSPRIQTWKASNEQNYSNIIVNDHPLRICYSFYTWLCCGVSGHVTESQTK